MPAPDLTAWTDAALAEEAALVYVRLLDGRKHGVPLRLILPMHEPLIRVLGEVARRGQDSVAFETLAYAEAKRRMDPLHTPEVPNG